jgi:hypothetical protein
LQIEFEGFPGVELAFESLARERSGIELLNVREADKTIFATVYVPAGKVGHFEQLLHNYLAEKKCKDGRPLDNRRLVDTIKSIRAGSVRALWTDHEVPLPGAGNQPVWWEVWLPVRHDRRVVVAAFHELAEGQGIRVSDGEIAFRERTVLLARGSLDQLTQSAALLNLIAELRRPKETADFFDALPADEQALWTQELTERLDLPSGAGSAPHVTLLDTGVNRGHPLIEPLLEAEDSHSVDPGWGVNDWHGHGTEMAGLALYGDLTQALAATGRIQIFHRLESVKLLRHSGDNGEDPDLHGHLFAEAIARPEIKQPKRARVFASAVTSRDGRDRGRPSAWSAAVDSLAADAEGDGESPRLIIVSAGNVDDNNAWSDYPDSNATDSIHDPGQSWNALTVGACTDLIHMTEEGAELYQPVAEPGGLSPYSTTSVTWQPDWPKKPELVLEGGNVAEDGLGPPIQMASLSLLTTSHQPLMRSFSTAWATSASCALAGRMAAELMAAYPELRPETIRGLLVHSARWSEDMLAKFLPANGPTKRDYENLLRHCGFGMPNLQRAMWSVANSLVLVVEQAIQPFERHGSTDPTLKDCHIHTLPWPLEELEELGDTEVEMRVTLSYFVEPNPSSRGPSSRYRYASHGLRFDVKRPTETPNQFRQRVNRAARDEEAGHAPSSGDDEGWLIGKRNRHKGSIHADIWCGSAADLASRGMLAVYPALGWWKTRKHLMRYDKVAPYSLVVSIHAPSIDLDLYAAVATKIATGVSIET